VWSRLEAGATLGEFVDFDEADAGGVVHAGGLDGVEAGLERDEKGGVFGGGAGEGEGAAPVVVATGAGGVGEGLELRVGDGAGNAEGAERRAGGADDERFGAGGAGVADDVTEGEFVGGGRERGEDGEVDQATAGGGGGDGEEGWVVRTGAGVVVPPPPVKVAPKTKVKMLILAESAVSKAKPAPSPAECPSETETGVVLPVAYQPENSRKVFRVAPALVRVEEFTL
jgi:hypothetical protein